MIHADGTKRTISPMSRTSWANILAMGTAVADGPRDSILAAQQRERQPNRRAYWRPNGTVAATAK
jgi:hypothetical protein